MSTWVEVDTMLLRITRYGKMTWPSAYTAVTDSTCLGGLWPTHYLRTAKAMMLAPRKMARTQAFHDKKGPHAKGPSLLFFQSMKQANLVLKSGEVKVIDNVLPKANRMLVFPSNRLHAPRPLSKTFEGLRVVLVTKFAPADGSAEFVRPVEMTDETSMLAVLQRAGAARQRHSGRTLSEHLWGTCKLLQRRQAPADVCRAGHLATVDHGTLPVTEQEQLDLLQIERANLDEQGILDAVRRHGL